MADKDIELNEVCQALAKSLKVKLDEYAENLRQLRVREINKAEQLAKKSPPGKFSDLPEKLKEKGHSAESAFAIAWSAKNKADKKKKLEKQMGGMTGINPGMRSSGVANPVMMSEDKLNKETLCKKCGKSHAEVDKCEMAAAKVVGNKGMKKDETIPQSGAKPDKAAEGSVLPGDKKSKKVKAEGSGGLQKVSIPEVNQELGRFKSLAGNDKKPKLPGITKPRPKGLRGVGHDIEGSMVGGKMPAVGSKVSSGARPLDTADFGKTPPPGAGRPNPAAKKSERSFANLKKSLGSCVICKALEHNGLCKQ